MKEGVWYDLNPLAVVASGTFSRVRCIASHPERPNDYIVSGVPRGGAEEKTFVINFSDEGVVVTVSDDQRPDAAEAAADRLPKGGKKIFN